MPRAVALLLNVAHAMDHMFLLIFATSVAAIAADFGFAHWEDLMPYGAGAFAMFGLCSLPAGRLGDLWGRRQMMLVFFFGMGVAALLASLTRNAWQLAAALTAIGTFASIYHPVGIPMLVYADSKTRPGLTRIGFNGAVRQSRRRAVGGGHRLSRQVRGLARGVRRAGGAGAGLRLRVRAPGAARARGAGAARHRSGRGRRRLQQFGRLFAVMTIASATGSLLFNFTTNGNGELLRERFAGVVEDPATLGMLLALVYVIGSFAQVAVGLMIDRIPLKYLYAGIVALQVPLFALAASAQGWALYVLMIAFMIVVFGAIPFTDAMIVRYVDDRMRSRVSGMRLTVAFGVSSLAVWLLGPVVKVAGFRVLLLVMAGTALLTFLAVLWLPRRDVPRPGVTLPDAPPGSPRAAD